MTQTNPLDSVYFITLGEHFTLSKDAMHIDPTIPLPVQKKDNDAPGNFVMEELTEEQVLAGLLTVMAHDPKNQHIAYYRSLLKNARPNLKKELTEAAILKAKNEDFALAEEIFRALHGFDPDDMALLLNLALFFDQRADAYRRSGLLDDADAYDDSALRYYKDVMNAEPEIPDAFFNAGFFFLKKRTYSAAKNCFETYLALTCDAKDGDLDEQALYKQNRAQQMLDEIANHNMDDEHFAAAYDLIERGEETKALEEIRTFLQKNPEVWNAWFMLGWALRRLRRYDDAKQAFEKSLACEGGENNADTYNECAICEMESGNLGGAKALLEKALTLAPESTKIMSNLGYLALKEGNPAVAASYFQTVLEFDPQDKIAQLELAKLDV